MAYTQYGSYGTTLLGWGCALLQLQPVCQRQSKFISLSLAFKTDKLTLANRLELQQRQRDTAERNIENEIEALKNAVGVRETVL